MKATRHPFAHFVILLLSVGFTCTASLPARAGADGGDGKDAPPARPRPDRANKVFTNDDLQRPGALPVAVPIAKPAEAEPAPVAPAQRARAQAGPYIQEKDPQWYAQQVNMLQNQLARIDADDQYLRQFWNNGNAPATGMVLNSPCEGLSTNNRIAQLDERRREIEAQMDTLEDTARRNGLPPGIFVQASEILEASRSRARLTPQQEHAALRSQLDQEATELAQTQETVAEMRADTAARSMSLLQPTGSGANMTTDLLRRLNTRSTELQEQITNIEDEVHREGVPPGDLR